MIEGCAPPGARIRHLPEVDSTNRYVLSAAQDGEAEGLVAVADVQREGRGRQGRRWESHPGSSLTFSLLRRPPIAPHRAPLWTLLAGHALWTAAKPHRPEAWLKWPNDLFVGERKLAGVLCELSTRGPSLQALVVGVGMNLRVPPGGFPPDVAGFACALRPEDEDSPPPSSVAHDTLASRVLEDFLSAFFAREAQLLADDGRSLLPELRQAMAPLFERKVWIEGPCGPEEVSVHGLRDNGSLEVLDGTGGRRAVLAGDVHLGPLLCSS